MSRSARFRALAGVALAVSLIGGGLAALADTATCNSWTDPKGDASTDQDGIPGTEDSQLDIVGASFGTVGESLVATITTDGLSATSSDAGDEFTFTFTIAGQEMEMYVDRTAPGGEELDLTAAVYNKTSSTPDGVVTAAFDLKTKTITFTSKLTELAKAVGKPVANQEVSALAAHTSDLVIFQPVFAYDDAPTTLKPVLGVECGGSSAPAAPAESASPSPSASAPASPSPSASASSTTSPTASPSTSGAPAPPAPLPLAGCVLSTDPKGDAHPLNASAPNDPDLDLTGLTFATSGANLVAFAKVDKLGAGPSQSTDGHRFSFLFTHNKHVFAMAGSAYKNAASAGVKNGLASSGQFSAVTQLSVDGPGLTDPNSRTNPGFVASGLKFTFDQKNSYVIASLPIADVEKYGKAPFAGAELTGIYATSATDTTVVSSQADIVPDGAPTTKPSTLTYTGGDSSCLAPSAAAPTASTATATMRVSAPTRVQTSDVQVVAVTLTGPDGKPSSGATVTGKLGSGPTATGKTNSSGKATLRVAVTGKAGTYALAVTSGKTTVRRTTTVLAERSLLNYTISGTGSTRLISVTLTDDDAPTRHPYAGAPVTFAYSGKSVVAKTDSKGRAAVRVKRGTKIDMTYPGRAGFITSAKRQTTAS